MTAASGFQSARRETSANAGNCRRASNMHTWCPRTPSSAPEALRGQLRASRVPSPAAAPAPWQSIGPAAPWRMRTPARPPRHQIPACPPECLCANQPMHSVTCACTGTYTRVCVPVVLIIMCCCGVAGTKETRGEGESRDQPSLTRENVRACWPAGRSALQSLPLRGTVSQG